MQKTNFTSERIAGFQCEPNRRDTYFWDAKTPGLGIRVFARGTKSYIFETRLHGKTIRITIGDVATWMIRQAQAEATRMKALTDQGIDPRQQKVEMKQKAEVAKAEALRQDVTLGDVWPVYLEARRGKWGEKHYMNHVNLAAPGGQPKARGRGLTVAGPLAALMPLNLSQLTPELIAQWLETESEKRPTNAAQSFRILRAFIRWAEDKVEYRGIAPGDSYRARQVRDVVPKSKAKDGDSLQREQLQPWFAQVRKIRNPVISTYLQGLLITGARREELAMLRWEDVDFQWCSLTIKDKVEGIRTIPLTPFLSQLLASLPRRNEWVFSSSTSESGHLKEPRIAHTKALIMAGLPHVSLHGLRRSFGTLAEWVEMPSGISAQIMGHKPSALAEKHYRRRPLDLLRMWHIKIEAWILEQAGIRFMPESAIVRLAA
jgi:integrase